jgi:hypothetical protein
MHRRAQERTHHGVAEESENGMIWAIATAA